MTDKYKREITERELKGDQNKDIEGRGMDVILNHHN